MKQQHNPEGSAREGEKPLSIYVHIPFCRSRCGYCDFPTYVGSEADRTHYLQALTREIDLRSRDLPGLYRTDTLYFGGGTPSLLTPEQLGGVLEALGDVLPFSPEIEFTLEANPGTISLESLQAYLDLGVTRLSLGAQSCSDSFLSLLDRNHSASDVLQAIHWAREAGVDYLSLDLMFGLPRQKLEDWDRELQAALSVRPDHLSLYALTLEKGTPFFTRHAGGGLVLPDDDTQAAMYELAFERLHGEGYQAYEISNFALPGCECRHNLAYWRYKEYLGLGVGAHSFMGPIRRWNTRSLPHYIRSVQQGGDPAAGEERLELHTQMGEYLMLGLRTRAGIDAKAFTERFSQPLLGGSFTAALSQAVTDDLLEQEGDTLRLTPRGFILANQLFCEFF